MLYKLRHLCPANVLRSLYFSLFHSHLSYGLPVWGNTAKIYTDKVLNLQKKAVRAITFADYTAPSAPIFKELEILSLNDLLKHQTASLIGTLIMTPFQDPSLHTFQKLEMCTLTKLAWLLPIN